MHGAFGPALPVRFFADAPACRFGEEWDPKDFDSMARLFDEHGDELAAVILEPVVQGAGNAFLSSAVSSRSETCLR